jgi:putative zinc finger protein
MKCSDREKQISDYLDGALDEAASRQLKEHIDNCPRCREILEEMKKTDILLRGNQEGSPPPEYWSDYWPRLKGKILEGEGSTRKNSRLSPIYSVTTLRWQTLLAIASVLILFLGGGGLLWKVTSLQSQLETELQRRDELAMGSEGIGVSESGYGPTGNIIPVGNIRKDISLFQGLQGSFANNMEWVVIDGDRVDLSLSQEQNQLAGITPSPLVYLNIKVFRKESDREETMVSSPRAVIRNGRELNAKFETPRECGMVYRVRSRPRLLEGSNLISLEIELEFSRGFDGNIRESRAFQISTIAVIEAGKTVTLGSVLLGNEHYRVEITVALNGSLHIPEEAKHGYVKI